MIQTKPGSLIARDVAQWWTSKRKGSLAILEQQIGDSIPDVVVIEKRGWPRSRFVLTALEVKSSRDKLARALKQCKSYLKWADYVYVVVEADGVGERVDKIAGLLDTLKGIGIIVAGRGFSIRRDPTRNSPEFTGLEWSAKKKFLTEELRSLGLRVSNRQLKHEIVRTFRRSNHNRREALSRALIATILSRSQILRYASRSFLSNS